VPVQLTLKLRIGLPTLRSTAAMAALRAAIAAGRERFGFRLVHYSVQSNHLHLITEASDRRALSRGVQALAVRMARALNRVWKRRGGVFADRYHALQLRTPRAVRNALAYVLLNHRRHGSRLPGPDPFSSGAWFDGWRGGGPKWPRGIGPGPSPTTAARCWLLAKGWRRWPAIGAREIPGPAVGAGAE
jgi:REP element-mobilizing transposase RayT